MQLKDDFVFEPLPAIEKPIHFPFPKIPNPLGPLAALVGTWGGKGFNVIWRPNHTPGQDRFLELNLTNDGIQFEAISGAIPNRGLLQPDINMFGITYLQQISDANLNAGLHIEPGIWAVVPATTNPAEVATVVRMASIPHGTTILAQGTSSTAAGPPAIPNNNILPFTIGHPTSIVQFCGTESFGDIQFPFTARSNCGHHAGDGQQSEFRASSGDRRANHPFHRDPACGHEAGVPSYGRRHQQYGISGWQRGRPECSVG